MPKYPYVPDGNGWSKPYNNDEYKWFEVDEDPRIPKNSDYKEDEEEKEIKEKIKKPRVSTSVIKKMISDMQRTELEPLQLMGAKVVGNLFDRVKFLRERITETETAINERKFLNEKFNHDIDRDIEAMEKMICTVSDVEVVREFKLNLTLLRMEKRKENTSYWRDMVELRNQLQELNEQYQTEVKIADIFSNLERSNLEKPSPSKG